MVFETSETSTPTTPSAEFETMSCTEGEMTNTQMVFWYAEAKLAQKRRLMYLKRLADRKLFPIQRSVNIRTQVVKYCSEPIKIRVQDGRIRNFVEKKQEELKDQEPKVEELDEAKRDCPHAGLNYGPLVYKTNALPLSYKGYEGNRQKEDE